LPLEGRKSLVRSGILAKKFFVEIAVIVVIEYCGLIKRPSPL